MLFRNLSTVRIVLTVLPFEYFELRLVVLRLLVGHAVFAELSSAFSRAFVTRRFYGLSPAFVSNGLE